MTMKILIFGASGQLGRDIVDALSPLYELICPGHETLSVESGKDIADCVSSTRPSAIINAAAFHDPEQCEAHPLLAFSVNALGPLYMARAADAVGAIFYHISTDYVFSGTQIQPYVESDFAAPCNVYGHSKLAGERFALAARAGGYVLRVGGLYGAHPCRGKGGRNFIRTMLMASAVRPEVAVVDDELITPTATADVAQQLARLLSLNLPPGIYHATAQGHCSWLGFAREIFTNLHLTTPLRAALPGEFPLKAPRPRMSVLENAALAAAGADIMPPWRDALRTFLSRSEATVSRWRAEAKGAAAR
jgi:dTDP-4-dehydrorhamnose reductase